MTGHEWHIGPPIKQIWSRFWQALRLRINMRTNLVGARRDEAMSVPSSSVALHGGYRGFPYRLWSSPLLYDLTFSHNALYFH